MSIGMYELREAIITVVAENNVAEGWDGNPADHPLVEAWNAVCEASPTVGIPEPITAEDCQ